jgi:hypothetical protein
MKYKRLDNEYYVMSIDKRISKPLLACGKTDFSSFLRDRQIKPDDIEQPLTIFFAEPYPKLIEQTDLLMFGALYAGSYKLKRLFEKMDIFGAQFLPLKIIDDRDTIIEDYYALHIWNVLPAIDKDAYIGGEINEFGHIQQLRRFSLDLETASRISVWKRLIFNPQEAPHMIIAHRILTAAIAEAELRGIAFTRINKWEDPG